MTTINDSLGGELASAVKRARQRLGLTQQGLALACGLSRQTIAQVEAGSFSDLGVRKVQRMLAALGLSLGIAGGGGAREGSRIGRLFGARASARRAVALDLAARTLDALREKGVSARVVGSLASGKFRADSDVDYLVESRGGLSESRILAIVEASMKGFPFDVMFAGRIEPGLLEMMRKEARLGASAVRAA